MPSRRVLAALLLLLCAPVALLNAAPRLQTCSLGPGSSSCALRLGADSRYTFSFCALPDSRAAGGEVAPELDFTLLVAGGEVVHRWSLLPHQRGARCAAPRLDTTPLRPPATSRQPRAHPRAAVDDAAGCSYGAVEGVSVRAGGAYSLTVRCQGETGCGTALLLHVAHSGPVERAAKRPPPLPAAVLTPCGARGRAGPTLEQCRAWYASRQPLALDFGTPPGGDASAGGDVWQVLTLPRGGTYRVVGGGAAGVGGFFTDRCRGARVAADVTLPPGSRLYALVGQRGGGSVASAHELAGVRLLRPMSGDSGGGGGGTHVLLQDGTPLLVAGGGGGMLDFRYNAEAGWCDAAPLGRGARPGVQSGFAAGSQPVRVPRATPAGEPQCCTGGGLYSASAPVRGPHEGGAALAGGSGGSGYPGPERDCPGHAATCPGRYAAHENYGGFGGGGGGGGGGGSDGGTAGVPQRDCFGDRCSYKAAFGGGGGSYCRTEAPASSCADDGFSDGDGFVSVSFVSPLPLFRSSSWNEGMGATGGEGGKASHALAWLRALLLCLGALALLLCTARRARALRAREAWQDRRSLLQPPPPAASVDQSELLPHVNAIKVRVPPSEAFCAGWSPPPKGTALHDDGGELAVAPGDSPMSSMFASGVQGGAQGRFVAEQGRMTFGGAPRRRGSGTEAVLAMLADIAK